jgi:RNA polymerase-associated protein CTR9
MYHRAGKKESFAQLLTVALGDDNTRGSGGN